MARKPVIPDPLTRRHLVEETLDPRRALRIAEAYLEAGRSFEAVSFLHQADDRERLEALRREAVETGDPFLLRQVCDALGEAPDRECWRALAESARRMGKDVQARDAERQAELTAPN